MNRPLFRVIEDKSLLAIAQAAPPDHESLTAIGLTARQIQIYGDQILLAVQHGQELDPIRRPRHIRPNQAYLDRLKKLSDWRKTAAGEFGTESDIVLPKNWMHLIAEENPGTMKELVELIPLSPWRLDRFGKEILQVLKRKGPAKSTL
jgi:ribonuclease D